MVGSFKFKFHKQTARGSAKLTRVCKFVWGLKNHQNILWCVNSFTGINRRPHTGSCSPLYFGCRQSRHQGPPLPHSQNHCHCCCNRCCGRPGPGGRHFFIRLCPSRPKGSTIQTIQIPYLDLPLVHLCLFPPNSVSSKDDHQYSLVWLPQPWSIHL